MKAKALKCGIHHVKLVECLIDLISPYENGKRLANFHKLENLYKHQYGFDIWDGSVIIRESADEDFVEYQGQRDLCYCDMALHLAVNILVHVKMRRSFSRFSGKKMQQAIDQFPHIDLPGLIQAIDAETKRGIVWENSDAPHLLRIKSLSPIHPKVAP